MQNSNQIIPAIIVRAPKIIPGSQRILIGAIANFATWGAITPPTRPPIEHSPTPEFRTLVGNNSPA